MRSVSRVGGVLFQLLGFLVCLPGVHSAAATTAGRRAEALATGANPHIARSFAPLAAAARTSASLRDGWIAKTQLDLVGLELDLPTAAMSVPLNVPFSVPVTLTVGGQPAASTATVYSDDTPLLGTLTSPGQDAPLSVSGTLKAGLSIPGLREKGTYTLSNVQLVKDSQVLLSAKQPTFTVNCLGEILLTGVTSSLMNSQEIKDSGIQLEPGDYVCRRFEMTLSVGGQDVKLKVPVATPVYNGLEDPRGGGEGGGGLQIGNIEGGNDLSGLSVVVADLTPPMDPFLLSRPELSFKMRNGFKALLVVPGSIGYLKQFYRVNVVVFNALDESSPYTVSHLSAQWMAPSQNDDVNHQAPPLIAASPEDGQPKTMLSPDGQTSAIGGGKSAMASFQIIGNLEGSHALDFQISGQFEGGGLDQPVAIYGEAHGKVLVKDPTFSLMLVHPDVVRRGMTYTLEAHLTNTSLIDANDVTITIDKMRISGATLLSEQTKSVKTLKAGETAVMTFTLQAVISGQITSSYIYADPGVNSIFQLSAGIGPRNVTLNPDTVSLPDSLNALPTSLREAMVSLLNAAYDVATSQKALPYGVLPIARGTITTTMAQSLSQEGLFVAMGLDRSRVWWDLWQLFMNNPDPGFDQLVRGTNEGAAFRAALLDTWQTWPVSDKGPAELLSSLGTYGVGVQNEVVVAVQGASPGLAMGLADLGGVQVQGTLGGGSLQALPGSAWASSSDGALQLAQMPMQVGGQSLIVIRNMSDRYQTLKVAILTPVNGHTAPSLGSYDVTLPPGNAAEFTVGDQTAPHAIANGQALWSTSLIESLDPEPFQVLGVHRYDLSVSTAANPYGTQIMLLFNRPNKPLQVPDNTSWLNVYPKLIDVEANQLWQKVMAPRMDDSGSQVLDSNGNPIIPPPPAAMVQAFPRVVSCYLEKPVGPYVDRHVTLLTEQTDLLGWMDQNGNPLQGQLQWPIQSGLLPGGAIVKGHIRKLDGTGVPGTLTYWYGQKVNNGAKDLSTGFSFSEEYVDFYYPLISNGLPTDTDGGFQLDYVPAPIGDYLGPLVLQGNVSGDTTFTQTSITGSGQVIQMDLVLEGHGSVEGIVMDAQGQPISGADVLAVQEQRSSDFTQGSGGGRFRSGAKTDQNGHYRVDGLKAGIFSLQVLKSTLGAISGGQITSDGQVVTVNVVLQGKVGTIRAHVLGVDGRVRMDQAVRLGIPGGLIRNASSMDWVYPLEQKVSPTDFWATFTNVPAGDVRIQAPYSAPTPAPTQQNFLNPGQTLQIELQMADPSQLATVQVHVIDATGHGVAGAYVKFDASAGYIAQTRDNGYTDLAQLAVTPGQTVRAYVYHPNWVGLTASNSVMLQAGASYVEDQALLVVMPSRCVLSGQVVRANGSPVQGAYVALPPVYNDANQNRLAITDASGHYTIANVPTGAAYRLAVVGPDLLTAVNQQIPVAATDTSLSVNATLPPVASNTLTGTVFQAWDGSSPRIATKAMVTVRGQKPNITPSRDGNAQWGLPETVVTAGINEADMLAQPAGTPWFTFTDLPAGAFTVTASSSLYPGLVTRSGDFGAATHATQSNWDLYLKPITEVGSVQGTVLLADGQTPVAPGARVMVMLEDQILSQVLTQPGGSYAFPSVIPPSNPGVPYRLRVEDPQTGLIVVQSFELKGQEVKTLNVRLWGTGNLTVQVQDSEGHPLLCTGTAGCAVVSLQHSKSAIINKTDMPLMQLALAPADQGSLMFPGLLEGLISVQLDSAGLSGVASGVIPIGGGDQTIIVRLQPVGSIQGTLNALKNGQLVPVPAGRVDAYQNGHWLATSTTSVAYSPNEPVVSGQFMFGTLPTGAIELQAWDPETRQVGQATVQVQPDQISTVTMSTLDTGVVTIQVLQDGAPVIHAGVSVQYADGPALAFGTEATTGVDGSFPFILPPGTYHVQATDPFTLASGTLSFTRGIGQEAFTQTLSIQSVRSIFVTALPPAGTTMSLAGWRVSANHLDRSVLLDSAGQGSLQDMPVGTYDLTLVDDQGRFRGQSTFQVTPLGGSLQTAQLQATAMGKLQATVLDSAGHPVAGALVTPDNGAGLFTDQAGRATILGLPQGTWSVIATRGTQRATGSYTISTEGELASATLSFAPTAALHGVVLDPLHQPVPYISVSCGNWAAETATDATGHFSFQGLPLQTSLTILAKTAQGRTGVSAPVVLSLSDDPEVDVTLASMGNLSGQVTDALRPILPSLGVQVWSGTQMIDTVSADQTGVFAFRNLPAGQPLTLKIFWDDDCTLALQQPFAIAGEGQTTTLNLALPAFVTITGWSQDAAGLNAPMVVELLDGQGQPVGRVTTTVDIPTYAFRYLDASQTYQLKGFSQDGSLALAVMTFQPSGQTASEVRSLRMSYWPDLRLQLRYPDGSPAPGGSASATLQGTGGLALGHSWSVVFDPAGSATLQGVPPGTVNILVSGLPWQGALSLNAEVPAQAGTVEVAIGVLGLHSLQLQLRYPTGDPAPGPGHFVLTSAASPSGRWEGNLGLDGSAQLTGIPEGLASIQVTGIPNQPTLTAPLQVTSGSGPSQQVSLPVQGIGNVLVTVKTASGRILTGGRLWVSGTGTPTWEGVAQSDGSYLIAGIWIGQSFTLSGEGFGTLGTAPSFTLATHGTTLALNFPAPDQGSLQGTVRDAAGSPVAGAVVSSGNRSASTNASGAYLLTGLPVGSQSVLVTIPARPERGMDAISITADNDLRTLNLTLKGLGSVQVKTLDASGNALPGQTVQLQNTSAYADHAVLTATSDASGTAIFTSILEGSISASATLQGNLYSTTGTLSAGATPLVLTLKVRNVSTASGHVQRAIPSNTWPAGTRVSLGDQSFALAADGTLVASVPPAQIDYDRFNGSVNASVTLPSGLTLPLGPVTLIKNGETVLSLTTPPFGNLSGTLKNADDTLAPGATITVDGTSILQTDANGTWSRGSVALGNHHISANTPSGLAAGDIAVTADGQDAKLDLILQSNAVTLIAVMPFGRLDTNGYVGANGSFGVGGTSCTPYLKVDGGAEAVPLAPGGLAQWLEKDHQITYTTTLGSVEVTLIRTVAPQTVLGRDEIRMRNIDTAAHTVTLRQSLPFSSIQGIPSGQVQPVLSGATRDVGLLDTWGTVLWGNGADAPTSVDISQGIQWPTWTLQPGETRTLALAMARYASAASNYGNSFRAEGATRVLDRVLHGAPEWIYNGQPATWSNWLPAQTPTADPLPDWNATAAFTIKDGLGRLPRNVGDFAMTFLPAETLAPTRVEYRMVTTLSYAGLPAGGGRVVITLPGASPQMVGRVFTQTQDTDLVITEAAPILVTVLDAHGTPVQGASPELSAGGISFGGLGTDSNGVAGPWLLTPAAYTATVIKPNSNNFIQATSTLEAVAGVDNTLTLTVPATGALTMNLLGPDGLPFFNGFLMATLSQGSQSWTQWSYSSTVSWPSLLPGSWTLSVMDSRTSGYLAPVSVTVNADETATVTVRLPALGQLNVKVVDASGSPAARQTVRVQPASGSLISQQTDDAGLVTFVGLPSGTTQVSVTNPATGLTSQAVVTLGGVVPDPLILTLQSSGSVSVTLRSTGGAPVSGVVVVATPLSGSVQTLATDLNGSAKFVGLGTGSVSLTYGHVPGADSGDEPGSKVTVVSLTPGTDVPVTLTVPTLGFVTVSGQTQAGDPLPYGSFSIANVFTSGRRSSTGTFSGVVLGQPLSVRFGDGSAFAPVDAPAMTPTVDGQVLALTFPYGRLRVRLRHQDQSPLRGVQVAVQVPGATLPQTASTDATGIATFTAVPLGASVSCSATSGGQLEASTLTFTGPDQLVDLLYPAATSFTVHLTRLNPSAALAPAGWSWGIAPGSDSGDALPINLLDAVFPGVYAGTTQTVTASQYRTDDLGSTVVGTPADHNATWTASLTQTLAQTATEATLTLPARASATLVFQDFNGQVFSGSMGDTITVTMKSSSNPALIESGHPWSSPASRAFTDFTGATMPEVFTEGTHVLSLHSDLWGDLADATLTVKSEDDGKLVQVPVPLDWLKTSYALRAVAGDGQTPVPDASFQLKANGMWLGYLPPSSSDGILADTDTLQGQCYVPRGRQVQFTAQYYGPMTKADGTTIYINTPPVDGTFHDAGDSFTEAITLPLTAARARLTELDGTTLDAFAADLAPDRPLPIIRIQGLATATLLGADPGTVSLTLYEPTSGLGVSASMIIPVLGQPAATTLKALPAYAWLSKASFQDVQMNPLTGLYWISVSADAPGLVKPSLAQWFCDPSLDAPWQTLYGLSQIGSGPWQWQPASDSYLLASGFRAPSNAPQGLPFARVRVPLQGVFWIGTQSVDPDGNPQPGPFASQAFSLSAGTTSIPSFQEPSRTWVDLPVHVQDGAGNPIASAVLVTPAHAPFGWGYAGTLDGSLAQSDANGDITLHVPQGETLRIEIAPPGGCGLYWYGFLDLTVPNAMPSNPFVLKADSQKGTECPPPPPV